MKLTKILTYIMCPIILSLLIAIAGTQNTGSQATNQQDVKSNKEKNLRPDKKLSNMTGTDSQAREAKIHEQVRKLLERAPILDPKPSNALDEKTFIEEAMKLLVGADWEVGEVKTALDAVAELEIWFSSSPPVKAEVTSHPTGLDVEYRRVVDTKGQFLNTTTDNTTLMVAPVLFKFICKNKNGETKEKTIPCTNGCKVRFEF